MSAASKACQQLLLTGGLEQVTFHNEAATFCGERTVVLGFDSMPEQLHWVNFIQKIIKHKDNLSIDRYLAWREQSFSSQQEEKLKVYKGQPLLSILESRLDLLSLALR
jgi:hypothetical protein